MGSRRTRQQAICAPSDNPPETIKKRERERERISFRTSRCRPETEQERGHAVAPAWHYWEGGGAEHVCMRLCGSTIIMKGGAFNLPPLNNRRGGKVGGRNETLRKMLTSACTFTGMIGFLFAVSSGSIPSALPSYPSITYVSTQAHTKIHTHTHKQRQPLCQKEEKKEEGGRLERKYRLLAFQTCKEAWGTGNIRTKACVSGAQPKSYPPSLRHHQWIRSNTCLSVSNKSLRVPGWNKKRRGASLGKETYGEGLSPVPGLETALTTSMIATVLIKNPETKKRRLFGWWQWLWWLSVWFPPRGGVNRYPLYIGKILAWITGWENKTKKKKHLFFPCDWLLWRNIMLGWVDLGLRFNLTFFVCPAGSSSETIPFAPFCKLLCSLDGVQKARNK